MGGDTVIEAPPAPPPRDIGEETRDTLEAQIELAPERFAIEEKYRPLYADLAKRLNLKNLGIDENKGILRALIEDIVPAQGLMKRRSTMDEIETIKQGGKKLLDAQRAVDPEAENLRKDIMEKAQSGLDRSDQFDQINELQKQRLISDYDSMDGLVEQGQDNLDRGRRLSDYGMNRMRRDNFGGLADRLQQDFDTNVYDELVQDAQEEFRSGAGLTARERRELDQGVLEGAVERGMEDQASTLETQIAERLGADRRLKADRRKTLADALGLQQDDRTRKAGLLGNVLNLQEQASGQRFRDAGAGLANTRADMSQLANLFQGRANFEESLLSGLERSVINQNMADQQSLQNAKTAYDMSNFDILQAMTGRSGQVPGQASAGFGSANFSQSAGPTIFNPESAYAGNLFGQNFSGQLQNNQNILNANMATAQNQSNLFGGLLGFGSGLLGGLF